MEDGKFQCYTQLESGGKAMANFDEDLKRITDEIMQDGTIEKILREKVEKGFLEAVDSAFRWGKLKDAIENRVKEVLVPYVESYDMSAYIIKLDTVLTDIVNQTSLQDNAKILGNFQKLMVEPGIEFVTLGDVFEEYKKHVSKNMETSGRNVEYDDGYYYYEPIGVTADIVKENERPWSSFKHAVLELAVDEEEQQENLNFSIRLSRWESEYDKKGYELVYDVAPSVRGMRRLDDFEIYILRLARAGVRLLDDKLYDDDSVIAEDKPEPTYL